jgi:D-lyxose ketol-isomerase
VSEAILVEFSEGVGELHQAFSEQRPMSFGIEVLCEPSLRHELRADGHCVVIQQHSKVFDAARQREFIDPRQYPTIF